MAGSCERGDKPSGSTRGGISWLVEQILALLSGVRVKNVSVG